ncbi:MAG: hypothetical protein AUH15_06000 [Acidobacteriales bacterium 13_2_20CM_55_8]|jgi:hypothetical protein|nr:MAG: hypothetical protein AUH15_06000 [Acidobacteriales bacterium 13_2_20CM_55_8]
MKLRNKALFNALLGAGLYLLDPVRDRLAESIEDFTDRAQDTYETAAERMDRASRVIRGDDSHFMSTATALLIGVGIGVGVGLLFAPASGEEIRSNLADKVQDFGDKVRNRFSSEPQPASGTYGE